MCNHILHFEVIKREDQETGRKDKAKNMKYRYMQGSSNDRETVEFDIIKRGQYITTCVVDVDAALCGVKSFPCGNGDDVILTAQQQSDILKLIRTERGKAATK